MRRGGRVVFNDIGKQVTSIYVRAYAEPSGIELIAGLCDMKFYQLIMLLIVFTLYHYSYPSKLHSIFIV